MLEKSLKDLVKERNFKRWSVNEIRSVTCQLLIALEALKDIGILHADLKPNNVMLVDHKEQPLRIKLIDSGLALSVCKVEEGMLMQALPYRAPEVTLGLPLGGLGCIMAYMYFAINLFSGKCPYQRMRYTTIDHGCNTLIFRTPKQRLTQVRISRC
ncbi:Homeodomain-interacting protein kinase 1 [Dissostichus eleginoides]|uniref:Homeodomain-interacting protein kinase 1 n=1 Tax=Dissostichus eleginoides TaxID=100907 RepID=A0AAD9FJC4_DISEL|nr:Homeodomain-interacting protein kinase 1 [Dissostichus eleginoides]